MVTISKRISLIIFFIAGSIFIGIGIISIIDSNIPRFVKISENIGPNKSGIFTPDMNSGNIANIYFNESYATVIVLDPSNQIIVNQSQNNLTFNETIIASVDGKYKIQVYNEGNETLNLNLSAFSKASTIAFSGQMMLIITGIIVIGLGIKTKFQT